MKRRGRKVAAVAVAVFLVLFVLYLLPVLYYRDGFSFNTWFNGVYCTGRTVEEANSLLASSGIPVFTVTDRTGTSYDFPLEQADYRADFEENLTEYLAGQNVMLWPGNLVLPKERVLRPVVEIDVEKLKEWWEALPFVKEEQGREHVLEIRLTKKGFVLYDGISDRLDCEEGFRLLTEAVYSGETALLLQEAGAYDTGQYTPGQEEIYSLWEKVSSFQDSGIVYDMGDRLLTLDGSVTWQFLKRKEDGTFILDDLGQLVLDEKAVAAFINDLAEEYNTYGSTRQFAATRGDIVTVKGGIYGSLLDKEAEISYLTEALREKKKGRHVPAYLQEAFIRGKDDIGNTYIEVDMTGQKMYYYQEGECVLDTDIVTGNLSHRNGTPSGVNYVYAKQTDRVLRGPGYASHVDYWMPVKGGIGIHDADWRKYFGGEIYKTSGSHGCINTPPEIMKELYGMVEVGTPVVMFY